MDPFSSFDVVSAGLILFSGLFAYFRGLIKEVLLILNWILAIIVSYLISPLIFTTISEVDFIMNILGDSCELMMILSFIVGFTLALITISFITYRISHFIETSVFSEINKIFGLLFGFLRGGIIIVIFLIIYNQLLQDMDSWRFIGLSKSNEITLVVQDKIRTQYPKDIPDWLIKNYDNLLTSCVKK